MNNKKMILAMLIFFGCGVAKSMMRKPPLFRHSYDKVPPYDEHKLDKYIKAAEQMQTELNKRIAMSKESLKSIRQMQKSLGKTVMTDEEANLYSLEELQEMELKLSNEWDDKNKKMMQKPPLPPRDGGGYVTYDSLKIQRESAEAQKIAQIKKDTFNQINKHRAELRQEELVGSPEDYSQKELDKMLERIYRNA